MSARARATRRARHQRGRLVASPAAQDRGEPVWQRWLKRVGGTVFFCGVAFLLVREARGVAWHEVLVAAQAYTGPQLLSAAGLAAASLTLYSCFDLLGRRYTGHHLGAAPVMAVTMISYVFNLNLGPLVGALALRFRLYSRLGLAYGVIARVASLSMLTNWLGYALLAGAVFALHPPALPHDWPFSARGWPYLGAGLLALGVAYLLFSAFSRQRCFTLRGHELLLPSPGLAAMQCAMGAANWLLMSGILFLLLPGAAPFSTVVGVLLVAAVAGALAHIPAGLGVLEAVFVTLLSGYAGKTELLAALVVYRLVYYLAPLSLAALAYVAAEALTRPAPGAAPPPPGC
jgi:uncharacterized membrane protein YbhN (UPF0104 family)